MNKYHFDENQRFVIEDFTADGPFSSFLPGIAGVMGVPMWVFYVNRGQGIASFGVEGKNIPIMEFQPANKAYQTVPYTGFRTFIKSRRGKSTDYYEPFSVVQRGTDRQQSMHIGANELELRETDSEHGFSVQVSYFTLSGEPFAGLVREVAITNIAADPVEIEMLDGLPAVIPFGVNNGLLKEMNRTLEAWMEVFNLDHNIPFYRVRASVGDSVEIEGVHAGHFYLAFTDQQSTPLTPIIDPAVIFDQDTSLSYPQRFMAESLAQLEAATQISLGKTPCGFFGTTAILQPQESLTLYAIIGHISQMDTVNREAERLANPAYIQEKRREANALAESLTDIVATKTGAPIFDAYCRQNFLDNVLRGGWPILIGDQNRPFVYHIYSRKHGDLERDYNAFYLAAEYYSQGNGNYRDVNQNRRSDVLLNPRVEDFNLVSFINLIQADGYNPLSILGSRFSIPTEKQAEVLAVVQQPERLTHFLNRHFTPGQLLKHIEIHQIDLTVSAEAFLDVVLSHAEQRFEASFGEGYWVDHWTYNQDLIDSYLVVYPDCKDDLLFNRPVFTFYDSHARVLPRDKRYVLVNGAARQFGAIQEDHEKAAIIAARTGDPNLARAKDGSIFRTTLFAKLTALAVIKFATLDPFGMGIEMEAGRPGWYDALNGLPGLFGSSMPETFELARLLEFLYTASMENGNLTVDLPAEVYDFLDQVARQVRAYYVSKAENRDFAYWDAVSGYREAYREAIRFGFEGTTKPFPLPQMDNICALLLKKIYGGIERAIAMNNGIPPTYFAYELEDYEVLAESNPDGRPHIRARRFKPNVLPLFLEGPVRALKLLTDPNAAQDLYQRVKTSDLFDTKLQTYKINASLENQPFDIGRARAFTPGWLENESIWMHMTYKYLLSMLHAGLYDEFYEECQHILVPFLDPEVYGRSPLENSSFIVSSAHPDSALHGRGFVARLSGSTAEFLSIWTIIMAGKQPFIVVNDKLTLRLNPILPEWLFDDADTVSFKFLGSCTVVYHNPARKNTFGSDSVTATKISIQPTTGEQIDLAGGVIGAPYAAAIRAGQVAEIHITLG